MDAALRVALIALSALNVALSIRLFLDARRGKREMIRWRTRMTELAMGMSRDADYMAGRAFSTRLGEIVMENIETLHPIALAGQLRDEIDTYKKGLH